MPGLSTYWSDLYRKVADEQSAAAQAKRERVYYPGDKLPAYKPATRDYFEGENDRSFIGGAET